MIYSLEKHKSNSLYLSVFSEILQEKKYDKKDLIFFIIARDHIINYLKNLKGATSSLLLIKSRSFNISQCLSMIKNIVKIYYTEEIEIFFIEHFFKSLNSMSPSQVTKDKTGQKNVIIHNFIGILVQIFRGLRESGLSFKDLLTDFEEREKSRSRSREILKKEAKSDVLSIFSGEKKGNITGEEDDFFFNISNSKDGDSVPRPGIFTRRRSSTVREGIEFEEVYLNKKENILGEKSMSDVLNKGETFKTASSRKSKIPSEGKSSISKKSDNFENLPKFSQKQMENYIEKNFSKRSKGKSILLKEKSINKENEDFMKPRYSSRDNIYSESSISHSDGFEEIESLKENIDCVKAIDVSLSEHEIRRRINVDFEEEGGFKLSPESMAFFMKKKQKRFEINRNSNNSFIQIEDQDSEIERKTLNCKSDEKVNVFRTDNSSEVANSIFKSSLRNRTIGNLSIVEEKFDDYNTSKFGSKTSVKEDEEGAPDTDRIILAHFSPASDTSSDENYEEEKRDKVIIASKVYKPSSKFKVKSPIEILNNSRKQSYTDDIGSESERSLVQGTRAIRDTLRSKFDILLDNIIEEENNKNNLSKESLDSDKEKYENSTVKTKKNSSNCESVKVKQQPSTFNPYEKEANFINPTVEKKPKSSKESEDFDSETTALFLNPQKNHKFGNLQEEETDRKSKLSRNLTNLTNQPSFPSILKTDNEENLFSIFDQLTLKSTKRSFQKGQNQEETPLKPINLDKVNSSSNILGERKTSKNNRPRFSEVDCDFNNFYDEGDKENSIQSNYNEMGEFIFTTEVMKKKSNGGTFDYENDENFALSGEDSSKESKGKFDEEMIVRNLRKLSSAGKEKFVFEL